MQNDNHSYVALDVGHRRIGVAVAHAGALMPAPLTTLAHTDDIMVRMQQLLTEQDAAALVVGLPRGLDGQETAQTQSVRNFVRELQKHVSLPVHWQDEAVTSRQAEVELIARGKPYRKEDIDALAATYILEDFLREHVKEVRV